MILYCMKKCTIICNIIQSESLQFLLLKYKKEKTQKVMNRQQMNFWLQYLLWTRK